MKQTIIAVICFLCVSSLYIQAQKINHPSLLYTPQRIQQVKQRMQHEPKLQEAWGDIKKTADEALQKKDFNGLCYINLVDFDMIYGHRRDILGYTTALNEFDKDLEIFLANMRGDDVLFITADHGCDPGYKVTDHTRESVPLLGYSKCWKQGVNIGTRDTYADIAATLAQIFEIEYHGDGTGFLEMLK